MRISVADENTRCISRKYRAIRSTSISEDQRNFFKMSVSTRIRSSASCKLRWHAYVARIFTTDSRSYLSMWKRKILGNEKIPEEKIHDRCVTGIWGINGSFEQVEESKREKNFRTFWRSMSKNCVIYTSIYIVLTYRNTNNSFYYSELSDYFFTVFPFFQKNGFATAATIF